MDADNIGIGLEELFMTEDELTSTAYNDTISYYPLEGDQIRILTLEPGVTNNVLRGTLIHVSLKDVQNKYVACSYVWGQQDTGRVPLCLDYGDTQYKTSLGRNLGQFLHHVRPTTGLLNLWADALCINQADNAEKARQVARMVDIYKQCMAVFAWLGTATKSIERIYRGVVALAKRVMALFKEKDDIQKLMDTRILQKYLLRRWINAYDPDGLTLVERLGSYVRLEWMQEPLPSDAQYIEILDILTNDLGLFHDESEQPICLLRGAHEIAGVEWWRRMWTVQEFLLAPDVHFVLGTDIVPQQYCLLAFHACEAASDFISPYHKRTVRLPWLEQLALASPGGYPNFWTVNEFSGLRSVVEDATMADSEIDPLLLLAFMNNIPVKSPSGWHTKGATDPRDRIYALLGMTPNSPLALVPDYTKPIAQVYTEFSEAFLARGHLPLLWILRPTKNAFAVPSWSVDWSAIAPDTYLSAVMTQKYMAKSSRDIRPTFSTQTSTEKRMMHLPARHLGRIAHIYPPSPAYQAHPSCKGVTQAESHFANCTGIFQLYDALRNSTHSHEETLDHLLRFVQCVSSPKERTSPPPAPETEAVTEKPNAAPSISCFTLLRLLAMRADLSPFDSSPVTAFSKIVDRFERIRSQNCTVLMEEGNIGSMVEEAKIGDVALGVGEYEAVLVVRELADEEGKCWEIVGCGWLAETVGEVRAPEEWMIV